MSLPNFPVTTLVKFLSYFIKTTAWTSACISGFLQKYVTDIRGRIHNSIAVCIVVQPHILIAMFCIHKHRLRYMYT